MDDIKAAFSEGVRVAVASAKEKWEAWKEAGFDDGEHEAEFVQWLKELDEYNVACHKWDRVQR